MTRSNRVRRAVSLTLAVLCLLVVPQVAFARFSSSTSPSLSVGTATLVTPSAVTGTYTCKTGFLGLTEGAEVTVTGFTVGGQPSNVSYTYALFRGNTQQATVPATAAKQAFLDTGLNGTDWATNTTYRLTIGTKLGLWTAPEYSKTFTCGGLNPRSGSL